jgi:protein-disulfide isomerase
MPRWIVVVLLVLLCGVAQRSAISQSRTGPSEAPRSSAVAVVGDHRIEQEELDRAAGHRLFAIETQLYRGQRSFLDELIADALLAQEARKRGVTVQDLVKIEIQAKAAVVTVDEARAVLESAGHRLGGAPEGETLERISASMSRSRELARRTAFLAELRARTPVQVFLEAPRVDIPRSEDGASKGPSNAPVRIVVFSEFQCPFCSRHATTLKTLETRYEGRIRVEFRHFPLPIHREAPKAAEAALCAGEQRRFWPMHDLLFANQKALSVADFERYAATLELDAAAFGQCLKSGKFVERVSADRTIGQTLGVAATPATFINGRLVPGAVGIEQFVAVIDEELDLSRAARGR